MMWKNCGGEQKFTKDLPRERGKLAEISIFILVAALLICSFFLQTFFNPEISTGNNVLYVVVGFFGLLLLFVIGHFLLRIGYCIEELMHVCSRYENSLLQLLRDTFSGNVKTCIVAAVSVFCVTVWSVIFFERDLLKYVPLIPVVLAAYCFGHLMKMDESPHQRMRQLKEMNGLDYGSGMAYSFFYGYLNMMLPDRGDGNMGLKEKIELFCNKEKLTSAHFPVKKLFVLIPASGHIAASLTHMDDTNWLDESKCLEEEIRNIAGVMSRSYKNSLYKIRDPNPNSGNKEVVYVVAEGATPVKTYHNAMSNDPKKGSMFKKYQKEVTLRFYTTLVDIIQSDKDCCNLCEVIYYKDVDKDGNRASVSDVLKERIAEINNRHIQNMEAADENASGSMRLLESPSG